MHQAPKTYYCSTTLENAAKIAVAVAAILNFNLGIFGIVSLIVAILCFASPSKTSYNAMKILCYVFAVFQTIWLIMLLITLGAAVFGSVQLPDGQDIALFVTMSAFLAIWAFANVAHNYYAAGICGEYALLLDGQAKAAPQVFTHPSHPQYPTQMPYSAPVQAAV